MQLHAAPDFREQGHGQFSSEVLAKFQNNKNALGWAFMLPTAVLLLLFLTYPLGLGTWLGFTDAKIGRDGEWIGLENFEYLWGDAVTRLALFNTLFYTTVASVIKFALGLWLVGVVLRAGSLDLRTIVVTGR